MDTLIGVGSGFAKCMRSSGFAGVVDLIIKLYAVCFVPIMYISEND